MSVKKYNVSKPEKYMKDGAEKTYWATVGTMTEFSKQDGSISRIIEIPAIGLKANLFEQQAKPAQTQPRPATPIAPANPPPIEYPEEEIDPADIPF